MFSPTTLHSGLYLEFTSAAVQKFRFTGFPLFIGSQHCARESTALLEAGGQCFWMDFFFCLPAAVSTAFSLDEVNEITVHALCTFPEP